MKYLTKEYQTFMDKVQHDYNIHGDKYENCDPDPEWKEFLISA